MDITVTVDASLRLRVRDLVKAGIRPRDVVKQFRHVNPDYRRKRAMGFWVKNVPQTLTLVVETEDEVLLPRGVWRSLCWYMGTRGVSLRPVNRTLSGTLDRPLVYSPGFDLDPDQEEAVRSIVKGRQGVIVAPCGGGKTEIAMAAISEIGERALVLVHTDRLLKRWVPDIAARYNLPVQAVGIWSGQTKRIGPVTVGMMQSVKNAVKRDPGFLNNFGMVIVDEAHHAPCATLSEIVNLSPAKWRIGLTATPRRKDGLEFMLWDLFGWDVAEVSGSGRGCVSGARKVSRRANQPQRSKSPTGDVGTSHRGPRVLFQIDDTDIDRHGRIVPVEVVVVPTSFRWDGDLKKPGSYNKMLDAMVSDRDRLALIRETLVKEVKAGGTCLLLADRREMCLRIRHELARYGVQCGLMLGGADRKEADKTERGLHDGTLKVAVGTTVADEGLDIKRIDRGFGCTPAASNAGRLTQQVGRFKRKAPGKNDAKYFYFWDRHVPQLESHLRKVQAAIKAPHKVTILGTKR